MKKQYSIDQYRAMVGQELGTSDWLTIDQDRVNGFAEVTDDHQFIHVDPERAKETSFGGTIAHGFLTLSLLTKFSDEVMPRLKDVVMGINYGLNKVRFLNPVKVGQAVRGRFRLKEVREKRAGQYLWTTEIVIEIDGQEKPACIAELLGLSIIG